MPPHTRDKSDVNPLKNNQKLLNIQTQTNMSRVIFIFITFTLVKCQENFEEFRAGNRIITSKLYQEILRDNANQNFFFSPFSIESVMSWVASGATYETSAEIYTNLNLPKNDKAIFSQILSAFKSSPSFTINSANKLYLAENFTIKPEFRQDSIKYYNADIENIEFQAQNSAQIINNWVETATMDKIRNLVAPENFDQDTKMFLVNALYFKAEFENPFDRMFTQARAFYHQPAEFKDVETMENRFAFEYFADSSAKYIKIPFKSNDSELIAVLPLERSGLSAVESKIDDVFSNDVDFQMHYVDLRLPKFKIETTVELKKILKNLGVKRAFDNADFSGISQETNLCLSDALQKAFVSLSEDGIEAAAATFNVITDRIGVMPDVDFYADHPFIFYIKVKGIIIFAGRVVIL